MVELLKVYRIAFTHFGEKHKTRLWLKIPNPLLPNFSSPIEMLRQGRGKKLLNIMESMNE
jgi:uncharacterized protein (DUF2384 family)